MNQKKLDKKIQRDSDQVKEGLTNLVEDKTVQMNRFKDDLVQSTVKAKDDLSTWVGDSTTQLSKGFDKLTTDAKETIDESAKMVEKDMKKGFKGYNEKAQKVADMVPGGFSKMVSKYPWVAITIGLTLGLILGQILRPVRHSLD